VGFHHPDGRQVWQSWLELPPQPDREVFAGGVLQSGNLIQITMVKCSMNRLPGRFDLGKIQHPTLHWVDLAAQRKLHVERVPMQARAGMGVRQRGQAPGALQVKTSENIHAAFSRKNAVLAMRGLSGNGIRLYTVVNHDNMLGETVQVSRSLSAALAAFLLLSLSACTQDTGTTLSAPEAYAQMQAGKLTLIDVRHPDEWHQTGVAQGALHIDMSHPKGEGGFVEQVSTELGGNKTMPIGLISLGGNRAANAQQLLIKAGFPHVYNIKEGMMGSSAGPGWIARGLPLDPCKDC